MNQLIWVTTQPDMIEFIWETMVQEKNFADVGIDLADVYCLFAVKGQPSRDLKHLMITSKMNILIYPDHRENIRYSPSVQPHLLKQFYRQFRPKYVMHLDSDVIMQRLPPMMGMLDGDWHVSNATSYIGYQYLNQFPDFLQGIQHMFGITREWLLGWDNKCGGAGGPNYLMCGVDETFFEEVEEVSTVLYEKFFDSRPGSPNTPKNSVGADIQIWTAGMWAWLWCAWKRNITAKVDHELDFCMSDHISETYNHNFFHNTGAPAQLGLFSKRNYQFSYPFKDFHPASLQYAQHNYVGYLNRIKFELDKQVTVIIRGFNPVLYELPCQLLTATDRDDLITGWWVIDGYECPTLAEYNQLLAVKCYDRQVRWEKWTIKRKLS